MSDIIPQSAALAVSEVGGKAASLARLATLGFNPPAFFVIRTTAFDHSKPCDGLEAALQELGSGPFAVRSSAREEDGAEHSHAGQFATELNVAHEDVWQAAKRVWKSGFSEGVATYRQLKSGAQAEGPAVIVQRMIDATSAGVAFSADPVSGARGVVVLSAICGLGERLVSGEEDGEDWSIDDEVSGPATPQVLTLDQAQQIADLARRIEDSFGHPQDIEWAFDGDGLHILQSRPITTPLKPAPQPDTTLTIFDNSNIVESYPGMVSPLTYSFAVHIYARVYRSFVSLLGVPQTTIDANAPVFGNMLGRIDGRVYYNLVNWYRALALLPGFSLNRAYMETMMGVATPMPDEVTRTIGPPPARGFRKVLEYLKLSKVGLGLVWQALILPRTRARFYERLDQALTSGFDPKTASPTALAAEYRRIETTLLDRWDAPLVNDFLCMIAFGASRSLLEKWLGAAGLALHNDVMIGQGDIISAEPAQRIGRIGRMVSQAGLANQIDAQGLGALNHHPEIAAEIQAYLTKFGDRCTEELKLESTPLTDDPTSLLQAITASARRGTVTKELHPAADWDALFAKDPMRKVIAKSLISWTKNRVRDRENLRFERTRIFGYTRRVFVALGHEFAARNILADPQDIFHLTVQEVLGAVEGFGLSPDLKSLVALRKCESAASAQRPDPAERIEMRGPAIARGRSVAPAQSPEVDLATHRIATGCSAGQVTATARVIRDPRRETLSPGEILVARHTDPGWISVFCNASAIVVERGSLLSHSAIVARELGIPCVVGLKDATQWIREGEEITVDGATGRVEKSNATV
jgi:pyruvate,water dikinase